MKKIAVISDGEWTKSENCKDSISILPMFRPMDRRERLLLLTKLRYNLPIHINYYNDDVRMTNADLIIVHDGHCRIQYINWLMTKAPNSKIAVYYWNSICEAQSYLNPDDLRNICNIYTYSRYDSDKYGLRFADTFFPYFGYIHQQDNYRYDVYFCGKDKGRLPKLMHYANEFNNNQISYKFRICRTRRQLINRSKIYSQPIPYARMMSEIGSCKAVLDCSVGPEYGMTLRPLEALFSGKKLITDNTEIKNEKIFDPELVYIIHNENDIAGVCEFLNTDIRNANAGISSEYYSIESWANRIRTMENL